MIEKMDPKPRNLALEYKGFLLSFKGYLKGNDGSFSYRCQNHRRFVCSYLLTVPIFGNFNPETWECERLIGAFQASTSGHSELCKRSGKIQGQMSQPAGLNDNNSNDSMQRVIEWNSDIEFLRNFIRSHPSFGPKSLKSKMEAFKQKFSLRVVKDTKKEVLEEIFPKDRKIAFCPSNCLCLNYEDSYEDTLYRYSGQLLSVPKTKIKQDINQGLQEFHIFANYTMLYQLERSKQWFIDGTFSIAPIGFQQLLIIVVYIAECKLFYPACYILATNKSENLYKSVFRNLIGIAKDNGFILNPDLITCDFERGLQNAIVSEFNAKDKISGCYFHFVKALITKCKQIGLIRKKDSDRKVKTLLGLLKLLAHCSPDKRDEFYNEIECIFKNFGAKYKIFLAYFKKNWLQNDFLKNLFEAYTNNSDISFLRTNNPCELFNRYLSKFIYILVTYI